jgi:hypothetical protein
MQPFEYDPTTADFQEDPLPMFLHVVQVGVVQVGAVVRDFIPCGRRCGNGHIESPWSSTWLSKL